MNTIQRTWPASSEWLPMSRDYVTYAAILALETWSVDAGLNLNPSLIEQIARDVGTAAVYNYIREENDVIEKTVTLRELLLDHDSGGPGEDPGEPAVSEEGLARRHMQLMRARRAAGAARQATPDEEGLPALPEA